MNVARFIDPALFTQSIDLVIERIKALPSADGTPVYLPGEIEFDLEAKCLAEGVPLTADVVEELNRLGERHGAGRLIA